MSPERPSHGFAVHRRREKEQARKEQGFLPIPSWETVSGIMDLKMSSNDDHHSLFINNRGILKQFYEARYDIAVGKGSKKLNEFVQKYTKNEKSKLYNPELIDKLAPHLTMIRDSFPRR